MWRFGRRRGIRRRSGRRRRRAQRAEAGKTRAASKSCASSQGTRSFRDSAQSVCFFRTGGTRPPTSVVVAFIDEHRGAYGVESICEVLPIAPSTYYEHATRKRDPARRPARDRRDEGMRVEVRRAHRASHGGVYGADKVFRTSSLKSSGNANRVRLRASASANHLISSSVVQPGVLVQDATTDFSTVITRSR